MLDLQGVGDRERIAAKLLDGVLTRGHLGCAVTANVITQHPEVLAEIGRLRIPHRVVLPERMREHDDGPIVAPVETVVMACTADGQKWHGDGCGYSLSPTRRRRKYSADPRYASGSARAGQRGRVDDGPGIGVRGKRLWKCHCRAGRRLRVPPR